MRNIMSRNVVIQGHVVHYLVAGRGEPVILIHGYNCEAERWRSDIIMLAEHFTIYAPDLPGYGQSQPLDGDYYIPELVGFIECFADNLHIDTYSLIGHSLGGLIALHCALKAPARVEKLVLVDSLGLGEEIAFWAPILSGMARAVRRPVDNIVRGIKWLRRKMDISGGQITFAFQTAVRLGSNVARAGQQTLVFTESLNGLPVPTLIIWGARDPVIPVEQAYKAAKRIPNCRLKIFENQGHNVYRNTANFTRALVGFLAGQSDNSTLPDSQGIAGTRAQQIVNRSTAT